MVEYQTLSLSFEIVLLTISVSPQSRVETRIKIEFNTERISLVDQFCKSEITQQSHPYYYCFTLAYYCIGMIAVAA